MVAFSLPRFKSGMAAEVRFIVPDSDIQTLKFILMKDDLNYIIHAGIRFGDKSLVINSKEDNKFGADPVKVDLLGFGPGDDVAIRFEARDDYWLVYINGKEYCQFKHRYPISDIELAKLFPHDGVKLISYSVFF